ncbi:hypothetical protein E4T49_08322 [Aureobasidium sp. EXF-10728]|nr:hypothetical protein E4T49_08322 [Aureobasidium sp. EXF-10728]
MSANLLTLLGNITLDAGGCPHPFISESLYPYTEGYIGGRNCAKNPLDFTGHGSKCCVPCPLSDWVNSSSFPALADGAAWVNVAGFILCGFLLVSYLVLPAAATRRSFLNIALLAGIMIMELGFIVPRGQKPEQCFDPVTPNDMNSQNACAATGGLVVFGGMLTVCWIVVRSVFMHLQICWDIVPGRMAIVAANVAAWSVTIALTAAVLAKVGVSYRFGGYCHVNVGSTSTYWGWMIGFGGVALLLQVATFVYCAKVYLTAAMHGRQPPSSSAATNSVKSASSKRQAWTAVRRLRQVLLLQWRSLAIVALAIFVIAFVCIIFIFQVDSYTTSTFADPTKVIPWVLCILQQRDTDKCLPLIQKLILPQSMAVAVLYVIAFVGIEAFILLFKPEIFRAWWRFLKSPFDGRRNSSTSSQNPSWLERPPRFAIDRGSMVAVDEPAGAETGPVVERQDSVVSEVDTEHEHEHAGLRARPQDMEKQEVHHV